MKSILASVLLILFTSPALADDGSLSGRVYDSQFNGLAGIVVEVDIYDCNMNFTGTVTTMTDGPGGYYLGDIFPAGCWGFYFVTCTDPSGTYSATFQPCVWDISGRGGDVLSLMTPMYAR